MIIINNLIEFVVYLFFFFYEGELWGIKFNFLGFFDGGKIYIYIFQYCLYYYE